MYCPSCGRTIPDGSSFCLHCGARIAAASPGAVGRRQALVEWEHKDLVVAYPPGRRGQVYVGAGGYTHPGARLFFWQSGQADIAQKLQGWLDEGWEPIGEVGPSCLQLRPYRKWEPDFGVIGTVIFGVMTLGLGLLASLRNETNDYVEVTEFRLPMRRPRGHG